MPLQNGSRLGRYEIRGPLGAGGMGEVYRAWDARLGREVALKVLRSEAMADPDLQRRFAQEARAASALNHPNILTVHDVGMEEGLPYIVSELIDGEPLSSLIERGPVPVRKLLEVAAQVAGGLAAAHQAGIIHRDLKPANIMLARNGTAKILDFGVAKSIRARAAVASGSETIPGMIVGTAAYMSPEQARGEDLDFRSDQFSFGLVLYRMLTGQAAFERSSTMRILAAIVEEDFPPIAAANPNAPVQLRWCVERCLAKDREHRYASSQDLYHELACMRDHLAEITTGSRPALPPPRRRRAWGTALVLAGTLAAGFLASQALTWFDHRVDLADYRLLPLATDGTYEAVPAWSPGGKDIAYISEVGEVRQLFVRNLGSPTAAQVTHAAADCEAPFWSPDGTRIYYLSAGRQGTSLWAVPAAGGTAEIVQEDVARAAVAPDGNTVVFLRTGTSGRDPLSLWAASPPGAPPRTLAGALPAGRRFRDGYLGFSRDGARLGLWLANWDGSSEFWVQPWPSGTARQAFRIAQGTFPFNWMPDDRHIVFGGVLPGTTGADVHEADTRSGVIRPLTATVQDALFPAPSPDGRKLAFTVGYTDFDLTEVALDGSGLRPLLASSRNEFDPSWSPVADQYAYSTDRTGVTQIWLRSRGGEWDRPLVTAGDFGGSWVLSVNETSFAPDGARIAYVAVGANGNAIYISNVKGGPPLRLTRENTYQRSPSWNPTGDWIAFLQNVDGRWMLVKARASGSSQAVVLRENCLRSHPKWSKRGDWITCAAAEGLTLVSPDGATSKVVSRDAWLVYGWNAEGTAIYGIKQVPGRGPVLAAIDVDKGGERIVAALKLPSHAELGCYSLAPDGKSFATSLNSPRADIWTLEGFAQSRWPMTLFASRPKAATP